MPGPAGPGGPGRPFKPDVGKKGKPNKAELKRIREFEARLEALKKSLPELKEPAASGAFDVDLEGRTCKGLLVCASDGTVITSVERSEGENEVRTFPAENIESAELKKDFGILTAELVLKTGEVIALCHLTPGMSQEIIPVIKSISDVAAGNADRRKEMPPEAGMTAQGRGRLEKRKVLKKMLGLATPHWKGIAFVAFTAFVILGVNMLPPYINKVLVDDFVKNETASGLALSEPAKVFVPFALTILALIGVKIGAVLINFLKSYVTMRVGLSTVVDIRKKLFAKVQSLSMKKVEQRTTGELMITVSSDAGQLQGFVNGFLPNLIQQILTLIAVSAVTAIYDWRLLVIFILPMPVTVVAVAAFHKKARRLMGRQREASSKTSSALHDILSGIRVVKAYGTEEREHRRFSSAAAEERDVSVKTEIWLAKLSPFIGIGLSAGTYFLLYFTGNMILGGHMTVGEAAMFSTYAGMIYGPLGFLANVPSRLLRVLTSANRVFELLDERTDEEESGGVVKKIEGNIRFENVSFGYDETSPVLKNIDLEMKPGEMIGLVGRSGVGKSTLINLVMRLYEVSSGRILIDGVNILDYDRECLRSQLGAVLQETVLISGSLYENLVYARPGATVEEVMNCSKLSGVHDFAVKLPDGYNTKIGEKGYTLSGGERQRVAIARAILRNPRILILDEATSSLDTEMEKQVQNAISALIKDRTTIAIAHRLSTLRNASKIVVLDGGRVSEIGTHKELMDKKGLYYELVIAQRQTAKRH